MVNEILIASGVGDYVASGLALTKPSTVANTPVQATPSTTSASTVYNNISDTPNVNECYDSWLEYWSVSLASSKGGTYGAPANSTATTTFTLYDSGQNQTTSIAYFTVSQTSYVVDGAFTISTQTIDETQTQTYTYQAENASTTTTTATDTDQYAPYYSFNGSAPRKPNCTLPSVVPQCQGNWESWIATQLVPSPTPPPHCDIVTANLNDFEKVTLQPCATTYSKALASWSNLIQASSVYVPSPICSAASIGGTLCASIVDNYVQSENAHFWPKSPYAIQFSRGTLNFYSGPCATCTSWTWPTSSTLGVPSCTLGCGRCAVTGTVVTLFYCGFCERGDCLHCRRSAFHSCAERTQSTACPAQAT